MSMEMNKNNHNNYTVQKSIQLQISLLNNNNTEEENILKAF